MVVTSHDVFDFCWESSLPFSVFAIIWPLFKACILLLDLKKRPLSSGNKASDM